MICLKSNYQNGDTTSLSNMLDSLIQIENEIEIEEIKNEKLVQESHLIDIQIAVAKAIILDKSERICLLKDRLAQYEKIHESCNK